MFVKLPFQLRYVTYLFVSEALISLVLYLKNKILSKIGILYCLLIFYFLIFNFLNFKEKFV